MQLTCVGHKNKNKNKIKSLQLRQFPTGADAAIFTLQNKCRTAI
jgi:hypothetical protein